jgi:hypothetical protein
LFFNVKNFTNNNMPYYALFFKNDNEIDYYPKLENHHISPVQIDEYIIKQSYKKWSLYDHMPNEEDIEVFSGFCYLSSDCE